MTACLCWSVVQYCDAFEWVFCQIFGQIPIRVVQYFDVQYFFDAAKYCTDAFELVFGFDGFEWVFGWNICIAALRASMDCRSQRLMHAARIECGDGASNWK
jgi:hypothetical protein